jgi:hypothetical protein
MIVQNSFQRELKLIFFLMSVIRCMHDYAHKRNEPNQMNAKDDF